MSNQVNDDTEASSSIATTQSSFCQALYFFYACGCRAPEPIFCCQPSTQSQTGDKNPCQHEKPTVVVAKLPHACKHLIGDSEACAAEDLGAKEFVREVDTAERLELAVSKELDQDEIDDILPQKMEGTFTVDEVVPKSLRIERPRSTFSAMAAPFVPRTVGCSIVQEETEPEIDGAETVSEIETETTKGIDDTGVSEKMAVIGNAEENQQDEDDESWRTDDLNEETVQNVKSGWGDESNRVEETTQNETTEPTEPTEPEDSDDEMKDPEFFDIDLVDHSREFIASRDKPSSSTPSSPTAEQAIDEDDDLEFDDLELNAEQAGRPSYDDMLNFWALDEDQKKAAAKSQKTSSWNIASLFGVKYCF
ncbi:hypothetical protein F4678DRAFT_253175 [Xylaria arbuscula]|nr:hypothetical protein F4678DRAFT_253175 [Xylaria arbuscula]